jgi:hypothetical protein
MQRPERSLLAFRKDPDVWLLMFERVKSNRHSQFNPVVGRVD